MHEEAGPVAAELGADPLIHRARDGDTSAFRSLYEMHARRVHALSLRVTADGEDAEERLSRDDAPENVARVKAGLDVLADQAAREIGDGDIRRYSVVRVADEVLVDLLKPASTRCQRGCCRLHPIVVRLVHALQAIVAT